MIILRAIITKKARGSPIPVSAQNLHSENFARCAVIAHQGFQFQNLGSVWGCTKGYPESQDFSELFPRNALRDVSGSICFSVSSHNWH